jgi:REP element-mobilizing transposase RayT
MEDDMVIGYHVIFTAYGFWLPNDPRGSWSDFVGSWELRRFGPATKTETRQSVAHQPHDRTLRQAAKNALRLPAVVFNGTQARSVGVGFAEQVRTSGLVVRACSILPEHVHMVIDRHDYRAEQMVNLLKGAATRRLVADNLHPFAAHAPADGRPPKCWARGCWKVFLDNETDFARAVRYVEENPVKEGKPRQRWTFVTPLDATSIEPV